MPNLNKTTLTPEKNHLGYFPFRVYLEFQADIVKLFLARMAEEQFAKIFSEKLFVAVFILPLETKEKTFLNWLPRS